jgi:hypothetical protein
MAQIPKNDGFGAKFWTPQKRVIFPPFWDVRLFDKMIPNSIRNLLISIVKKKKIKVNQNFFLKIKKKIKLNLLLKKNIFF